MTDLAGFAVQIGKNAFILLTGKEIVEITAKSGTLKRRQQIRYFLEHMPKDDHDDVFAGSPMQNKQIKVALIFIDSEPCFEGQWVDERLNVNVHFLPSFCSCRCFLQMERRKILASFRILRRQVLAWLWLLKPLSVFISAQEC